ncbi:26943_t:CDS:2, partial [Gigaspora margarita]
HKTEIKMYAKKIKILKRNAKYQSKCQLKKIKQIEEEQIVVRYDVPTKRYHHSAWVSVTRVSHDETKEHLDKHYCLASIKGARQFAQTFSDVSIIISQKNKSKIGLGVLGVGRMFYTLQSVREPVQVPDHDFVYGSNQKLIPSVYLMIKSSKINDDL